MRSSNAPMPPFAPLTAESVLKRKTPLLDVPERFLRPKTFAQKKRGDTLKILAFIKRSDDETFNLFFAAFLDALNALPENQRHYCRLHFLERKTNDEIALILELTREETALLEKKTWKSLDTVVLPLMLKDIES